MKVTPCLEAFVRWLIANSNDNLIETNSLTSVAEEIDREYHVLKRYKKILQESGYIEEVSIGNRYITRKIHLSEKIRELM